jgi:hypothetical protein
VPPSIGTKHAPSVSRPTSSTAADNRAPRRPERRHWFEFLVQLRQTPDGNAAYMLPSVVLRHGEDEEAAYERLVRRTCQDAHLPWPTSGRALAECLRHNGGVASSAHDRCLETRVRLYTFEWPGTKLRAAPPELRSLPEGAAPYTCAPLPWAWAAESELVQHVHVGEPSVFGVPVSHHALAAFQALPMRLRFASKAPPLVVYHGTSRAVGDSVKSAGLRLSAHVGMLGTGLYLANWSKAVKYTAQNALFVRRSEPGVVVRCFLFATAEETRVMTRQMLCTCGCAREFVDHQGRHGQGYRVVMVPNNSQPATAKAEWCVKDVGVVFADDIFSSVYEESTCALSMRRGCNKRDRDARRDHNSRGRRGCTQDVHSRHAPVGGSSGSMALAFPRYNDVDRPRASPLLRS